MALYDRIGVTYSKTRKTDLRIQQVISHALEGCNSVLNVGSGTGSYEPDQIQVVGVDPSSLMLRQSTSLSNSVRGVAEYLPFPDKSFDASMGVHTIHHWTDKSLGLHEMERVARDRVIIFTWDRSKISASWLLCDYFPASKELALERSAPSESYSRTLCGQVEVVPVPIPWDCKDGSPEAYWRRPREILNARVWQNISVLSLIPDDERSKGLVRLAQDLGNGDWKRKYGYLLALNELDMGLRLIISRK